MFRLPAVKFQDSARSWRAGRCDEFVLRDFEALRVHAQAVNPHTMMSLAALSISVHRHVVHAAPSM